jgi:hypothetical protein
VRVSMRAGAWPWSRGTSSSACQRSSSPMMAAG